MLIKIIQNKYLEIKLVVSTFWDNDFTFVNTNKHKVKVVKKQLYGHI